jgi:hypothetical protein
MRRRLIAAFILAALMVVSVSGCHFRVTVHAGPILNRQVSSSRALPQDVRMTDSVPVNGSEWLYLPGTPATVPRSRSLPLGRSSILGWRRQATRRHESPKPAITFASPRRARI